MNIGFAITRAASVTPTWSTIELARAALAAGHCVRFIEPWDFEINQQHELVARVHTFTEALNNEEIARRLWRRESPRHHIRIAQLDLLMMRAAPASKALLGFAMIAKDRGVRVINDPDGLMRVSQKTWLAGLCGVSTPRSVVTKSFGVAKTFYESCPMGVVLKPAIGSGGTAVYRVKPSNLRRFEEDFSHVRIHKNSHVVVQEYQVAAVDGESRIVWFQGKAIGAYRRQAAVGEFRHNLKQGATPEAMTLGTSDHRIISTVSPYLLECGITLAGIDVIGDTIIEINALNPGGIYHASRLSGVDLAEHIMHSLQIQAAIQS